MLFEIQSAKAIDRVCQDLERAVVSHKFGVMSIHNLKETMKKKGVEFERECRIFEVCNPHQAKRVLEKDMRISTALPCRISVFMDEGKVRLATLKPTALISHFRVPELQAVAREVEDTLVQIMTEAAE